MLMASLVPATVNDKSLFSCSSIDGLIINSPSIRPTFTPAIGPSKGISEIDSAIDAPIIAAISEEQSRSTLMTVVITCTSFRNPSGNSDLIERSISLDDNIVFSLGRPSLLINPTAILPTTYYFSSNITINGKKGMSFVILDAVTVASTLVSPYLTIHA